ncbi:MAG: signal peptidase I [Burkholderiales bacterium]|nr:signal peptidase I [Burkholderiales bacterium]
MNFALILFLLTLASGILWAVDRFHFRKKRAPDSPEPAWVEYAASFFPVLLVVFVLRSFVAEPFKIPSSSMRPTLEVGDFILVNKFVYGLRLPIAEIKVVPIGTPQRGDVVVFRYPVEPDKDFIKRVVGVGGDVVKYEDKRLTVNGQPLPQVRDGEYGYLERMQWETVQKATETAHNGQETHSYTIALDPKKASVYPQNVRRFPGRENCDYNDRGFTCKVPPGHYFMMGDNRDNSDDSRYWGFVPDDHIRGKAFFIWFNWDDIASFAWKRVGSGIH